MNTVQKLNLNVSPHTTKLHESKLSLVLWTNDLTLRELVSREDALILDRLLLKTWFVTNEKPPDSFPIKLLSFFELKKISRDNRQFVIKRIGNHPNSSWGHSVQFLHKMSEVAVEQLISTCIKEKNQWIIQPFFTSVKHEFKYISPTENSITTMKGRVRITPYFEFETGNALIAKAAIRKNTLLIHGASESITTIVDWQKT